MVLLSVRRYMKYLYPYECEKRGLSTPAELQAAIDGNRREGRRSSYGTYGEMVQRSPVTSMPNSQQSPLSLVTATRPAMNGNSNHHGHNQYTQHRDMSHHHPSGQHPVHPSVHGSMAPAWSRVPGMGIPCLNPDLESRMAEYVKYINKELGSGTPPHMSMPVSGVSGASGPNTGHNSVSRQGSSSPPVATSPQEATINALALWNLYAPGTAAAAAAAAAAAVAAAAGGASGAASGQPNSGTGAGSGSNTAPVAGNSSIRASPQALILEPQKEALNLDVRERDRERERPEIKREPEDPISAPPPKRAHNDDDVIRNSNMQIKINSRGDSRNGDSSLVVSLEFNGTVYQGVLFSQTGGNARTRVS